MGNSVLLPVMIVIIAALFFWNWRSTRKRRQAEAEKTAQLAKGVEVMTNFGLFGTVDSIDLDNNKIVLEVSPGTLVTVHRQTIARIETPAEAENETTDVSASEVSASTPTGTSSSAIDAANADAQRQAARASNEPEFGERTTPRKSDD